MTRLTLALLGTPQVALDGTPLTFAYQKAAALLFYLAVEGNRAHKRTALAALLWPETTPQAARQNLSQALTTLRGLLGEREVVTEQPPLLLVDGDAVQLNPAGGWSLDVQQFQTHLAKMKLHRHHSQLTCSTCLEYGQQLVSMYGGDFLEQFSLPGSAAWESWAGSQREQLRHELLRMLVQMADIAEWREQWGQALSYTRRQLALDPLREASHRATMRLLALSGQPSAARAHYRQMRDLLRRELDVAPEEATTTLHDQFELANTSRTALRRYQPPPAHVPVRPTPLIGREVELQALRERMLLRGERLVTIIGPPGIGKTSIAQTITSAARFDFAHGVAFIELAPLTDATLVPSAIAQILQIAERPGEERSVTLTRALREQQLLLTLDNWEHLPDAAPFVATLLAACPFLTILVTSRTPLLIAGEQLFPLATLPVPPHDADMLAIKSAAAVQLFIDRARAVRPRFILDADNATAVATICERLDGLPLAIELIAAQIGAVAPGDLLRRLDARLDALVDGPRDLPERHQTLRNAIHWSFDRLGREEQQVFMQLGVFVSGCTVEAAQAVVGNGIAVGRVLEALRDTSLIYTQFVANETRFLLLETIREFALEFLAASGGLVVAQQRHTAFLVRMADAAYTELLGRDQATWSVRLAAEQDNLRTAIHWALAHDEIESALRMATGVWRFWWQRGPVREALGWLTTGLARRHEASLAVQTNALRAAGVLAMGLNDHQTARHWLQAAMATAQQQGDTYAYTAAMTNMGYVAREEGDVETACAYLEESVAIQRTLVERPGAAKFPMIILAGLYIRMGRIERARELYEECLQLNRELSDTEGTANSFYGLGMVANARGEYGQARQWNDEAVALYGSLNHQFGLGWCLELLGDIAANQGEYTEALTHHQRALAIWMKHEAPVNCASVLDGIAKTVSHLGDGVQAVRLMAAAVAIRANAGVKLTASEQAERDKTLATCHTLLGEEGYQVAWAAGGALTVEEAAGEGLGAGARG